MPPDFLAIGHIVKDLKQDGSWRLGGNVVYATYQAARLGPSPAGVTACAPDIDVDAMLPWAEWSVKTSATTTVFDNKYEGERRQQRVPAQADRLLARDVPEDWRRPSIALLGPVAGEVDEEIAALFPPDTLVGISAQGYLRRLVGTDVRPGIFEPRPRWLAGNAVFFSEEDVDSPERAPEWLEVVDIVVLTRGEKGSTIWSHQGRTNIPIFESDAADPTGAGDVFATAFLIRYRETGDHVQAGTFAAAASSLAVRAAGMESIGTRAQIDALCATRAGVR